MKTHVIRYVCPSLQSMVFIYEIIIILWISRFPTFVCNTGNHDDPSRDGVGDPLAALDFFSSSNLINYVGKHEQVEDIEITPIIIRKGKTTIAIYPLGAIRDERLVKFIASFLNCFVYNYIARLIESNVDQQESQIS